MDTAPLLPEDEFLEETVPVELPYLTLPGVLVLLTVALRLGFELLLTAALRLELELLLMAALRLELELLLMAALRLALELLLTAALRFTAAPLFGEVPPALTLPTEGVLL